MGDKRKPAVKLACVANTYAGSGERIVEFSHHVGGKLYGGLISFRWDATNKQLQVSVYRTDEGVVLIGGEGLKVYGPAIDEANRERDRWEKEFEACDREYHHLLRKMEHGCTDANCDSCYKEFYPS